MLAIPSEIHDCWKRTINVYVNNNFRLDVVGIYDVQGQNC
jgi:hypothetical protein